LWAAKLPQYSARFERERRLSADVARQFSELGFFHMLVPEEYGGGEVHPNVFIDVLRTLATGDGSAGWNVMIGATTGLLSASLPEKFAKEIYGSAPGVLTVGVTAPMGRATKVEGGFSVTGRWPFASGCQNADWITGGCFIFDGDEQQVNDNGAPELHLMMFKASEVEIEDTWYVSGLCGTGSHHFNVKEQFVPEGRSVILGGRTRIRKTLYQFPMLGLLALGVSSVSLGIGYRALAAFKAMAMEKKATGSNRSLVERSSIQSDVAKSVADLRSSEAFMRAAVDEAWSIAATGERLNTEVKANLRLAAVNATHRSVAAVDRLYQAGGGSSIYENNVLQQCFRDVHVTTQHIMVATPVYEVTGRVELGLPPRSLL
jgi:alkylation response protein AidB-like acyl-CoA dehydrogenase